MAKIASETYVKGTDVIKKNNFKDHLMKSNTHQAAVLRLTDDKNKDVTLPSSSKPSSAPKQTTLKPYVQKMTIQQKSQLTRKFQLAHFNVVNCKSFSFYGTMGNFLRDTFKVDLGKSYLYDTAASEMIAALSTSIKQKDLTEPLNSKCIHYYSILNDGSSSAKTMDEKELFFIKSAENGIPKISLMSLGEPEECDTLNPLIFAPL